MIARRVRPADVHHDDVTDLQGAVRTFVVRIGTVRTRSDDDERDIGMPLGDNGFGDVRGNVGLGAAGHQELGHPGVHPVDRRTGLA